MHTQTAGSSSGAVAADRKVLPNPQRVQHSSMSTASSIPQFPSSTSTPTNTTQMSMTPAPAPPPVSIPSVAFSANQGTSQAKASIHSSTDPFALPHTPIFTPQNAQLAYVDAIEDVEVLQEVAMAYQSTVRRLQAVHASTQMQLASAERDHAYVQNRIQLLKEQRRGNSGQSPGVGLSSLQPSAGPTPTNLPTESTFDLSLLFMNYDDPMDG